MSDNLADAILASSRNLQVSPRDLGTVISYETGGTFDNWKRGPTTQHGQHRGLIQWGEPQRAEYGVRQGMSNAEQMAAVERYLTKAGVKPGMGLMDIYSAVNAGRVGRTGASDANNGGAPGTVADKVNFQMEGHKAKADALLSGALTPGAPSTDPAATGVRPPQLASMFGAMPTTPVGVAGAVPDPAGIMAQQFADQDADAMRQKQEAAAAVQRKRALFGPVAGMYA